jgi:hypothetical protein
LSITKACLGIILAVTAGGKEKERAMDERMVQEAIYIDMRICRSD